MWAAALLIKQAWSFCMPTTRHARRKYPTGFREVKRCSPATLAGLLKPRRSGRPGQRESLALTQIIHNAGVGYREPKRMTAFPRFRHQTLSLAITGFCGEEICARSPSALIITITCRTIRVPYHQRIDPVPRAHRLRRFSCSRLRNDDGSADRRRRRSNWTQRFPSTVPCAEAC
jgi:hypothetical protein